VLSVSLSLRNQILLLRPYIFHLQSQSFRSCKLRRTAHHSEPYLFCHRWRAFISSLIRCQAINMDFTLRCNALKCRKQLTDQAVVTTCRCVAADNLLLDVRSLHLLSHIFCLQCSDDLGLSGSHGGARTCPACGTTLTNPDDAVIAQLNPSEDYKTSVLSGLTPTIIMECAGRGLAFYSYQATQEMCVERRLSEHTLTDVWQRLPRAPCKESYDQILEYELPIGQGYQRCKRRDCELAGEAGR